MPSPPLVAYTVTVTSTGAAFLVALDPASGEAEFGFSIADAIGYTSRSWLAVVRTSDVVTAVELDGGYARSRYPIFDPTWSGAYEWLRFGFDGRPPATPAPGASVAPAAEDAAGPSVIAVVRAISSGAYRVDDRGTEACEDGQNGKHLRLEPTGDPDRYPATDLVLRSGDDRICTMRFDLRPTQFWALAGTVELHFAQIGGYEVVGDGRLQFSARIRGIGKRRVTMRMLYSDFSFPSRAPEGAFER